MSTKSAQRRVVRAALSALSAEGSAELSAAVCRRVVRLPAFRSSRAVCLYLPLPSGEVHTAALMEEALRSGRDVFVPKVTGAGRCDMVMVQVRSTEELAAFPRNSWGIPEPDDVAGRATCTDPRHPVDLVIVPGMAFDESCRRLGHGKGYYGM